MSDTDNNESYMKLDELSGKLKEGLSAEFSTIKGSINDLADKMDLTQKEKDGMSSVSDFVNTWITVITKTVRYTSQLTLNKIIFT